MYNYQKNPDQWLDTLAEWLRRRIAMPGSSESTKFPVSSESWVRISQVSKFLLSLFHFCSSLFSFCIFTFASFLMALFIIVTQVSTSLSIYSTLGLLYVSLIIQCPVKQESKCPIRMLDWETKYIQSMVGSNTLLLFGILLTLKERHSVQLPWLIYSAADSILTVFWSNVWRPHKLLILLPPLYLP